MTVALLKHDLPSYVFTLIMLFPVFLTVVFLFGVVFDVAFGSSRTADLATLLFGATLGMMIEWFLIGLSPWSNSAANPLLMTGFQLGMFSFWATVSFAPRLFTRSDDVSVGTRRSILRFYLPYFFLVYVVVFVAPEKAKFGATIILIVIGYFVVTMKLVRYLTKSRASEGSDKFTAELPDAAANSRHS